MRVVPWILLVSIAVLYSKSCYDQGARDARQKAETDSVRWEMMSLEAFRDSVTVTQARRERETTVLRDSLNHSKMALTALRAARQSAAPEQALELADAEAAQCGVALSTCEQFVATVRLQYEGERTLRFRTDTALVGVRAQWEKSLKRQKNPTRQLLGAGACLAAGVGAATGRDLVLLIGGAGCFVALR